MTTVDVLMAIDGALGGVLLIYDDLAWAVVTGILSVVVWMIALFGAVGVIAGGLGYLAGLAFA